VRDYCRVELLSLPPALRALGEGAQGYPVSISDALRSLAAGMDSAQARAP
jgi:hypothetical protein